MATAGTLSLAVVFGVLSLLATAAPAYAENGGNTGSSIIDQIATKYATVRNSVTSLVVEEDMTDGSGKKILSRKMYHTRTKSRMEDTYADERGKFVTINTGSAFWTISKHGKREQPSRGGPALAKFWAVQRNRMTLAGSQTINGVDCHVVNMSSDPSLHIQEEFRKVWFDKSTLRPVMFVSQQKTKQGVEYRTVVRDFRTVGGTPVTWAYRTEIYTDKKLTQVTTVRNALVNATLPDSLFDPNATVTALVQPPPPQPVKKDSAQWNVITLDDHVNVMAMQPDMTCAVSLAFDSEDFPSFCYYDFNKLHWMQYTGTKWHTSELDDVGKYSFRHRVGLTMDLRQPSVFYSAYQSIRHTQVSRDGYCNPTSLQSGLGTLDKYPGASFAVSPESWPALAYADPKTKALMYMTFSRGKPKDPIEVGEDRGIGEIMLSFDPAGKPGISYLHYDGSAKKLKYARFEDKQWKVDPTVDTTARDILSAHGKDGTPGICYLGRGGRIKYAHFDGSWKTEEVIRERYLTPVSLALDSQGRPGICLRKSGGPLQYAYHDGKTWVIEPIVPEGEFAANLISLAFDKEDKPLACFVDFDEKHKYHFKLKVASKGITYSDECSSVELKEIEVATIKGRIKDQRGNAPVDVKVVFADFDGLDIVEVDEKGNFEASFKRPKEDEPTPLTLLLRGTPLSTKYHMKMETVSITSGLNEFDFTIERVPFRGIVEVHAKRKDADKMVDVPDALVTAHDQSTKIDANGDAKLTLFLYDPDESVTVRAEHAQYGVAEKAGKLPWTGTRANGYIHDTKRPPIARVYLSELKVPPPEAKVTTDVAGKNFTYLASTINKYLNKGEKYRVGTYYGSDDCTYRYFGLTKTYPICYFRNPGVKSGSRNLKYKDVVYAPVQIYTVATTDLGDGTTKTIETTLGHLLIDQKGNIVMGTGAREILLAIFIGAHTFEEASEYRLNEELRFYKSLKAQLVDMSKNYDRMIQAGLAVKTLETGICLYLDVASGEAVGATITAASSALFFAQIYHQISTMDTSSDPMTMVAAGKAVQAADLLNTLKGAAELGSKLREVRKLQTLTCADDMHFKALWTWFDDSEKVVEGFEKAKDEATVETKKTGITAALKVLMLIDDPDGHTQKAVTWKVQATALIASLNQIIGTLEGIKDGIDDAAEAEEIMNLKYVCANVSYLYGSLLKDVVTYQEYRKHYTVSGNIYRGLRAASDRIGFTEEYSTEAILKLSTLLTGDGTTKNPGMAYYQLMGYYIDFDLAVAQAKWTLTRIEEK